MVTLTIENQNSTENNEVKEKITKEVYIISQEIKIAKNLSCCDLKLREKQLRKLKKWLQIRSASSFEYTDDDLLRIWKGLFYCFWMSDKPLVQEDLAEEFGRLIDCFKNVKSSLRFFNAFLKTMSLEWFGLDQWRLDKFLMLTRRMLRYTLMALKKENWPEESIQDFNFFVAESVLDNDVTGMIMHLVEIFLDELAKVSNGNISAIAVAEFTKPFVIYLAKQRDPKTLADVRNKIFYHLLWQSEVGRVYQEKFEAWKEMGFPNINLNELEKVDENASEIEDENGNVEIINENVLDPRAGNVDVFIPVLPVDTRPIVDVFEKILENEIANTKSKKFIMTIMEKYNAFESGTFLLGIKRMPRVQLEALNPLIDRTVEALEDLDDELHGVDRNLKKLNKSKRKKLLESLNLEEANENNYDTLLKEAMVNASKKSNIKSETVQSSSKKRKATMEWTEEPTKQIKIKKENKDKLIVNGNINKKLKKPELNGEIKEKKTKVVKEKPEKDENENKIKQIESEWEKPMEEGEVEYFVSSTKIRLKEANKKIEEDKIDINKKENINLVFNPLSAMNSLKTKKPKNVILGKKMKKEKLLLNMSLPEKKKVKIALGKNMVQKPSEYMKQIRNSPQVPYDADKRPVKSLLKPNLMPSPINPFYKKKIGLQLNDTF